MILDDKQSSGAPEATQVASDVDEQIIGRAYCDTCDDVVAVNDASIEENNRGVSFEQGNCSICGHITYRLR